MLTCERGYFILLATFSEELGARGAAALAGMLLGGLITWFFAYWKRIQERRSVFRGDARDTVILHHHIVEPREASSGDGSAATKLPGVLRIRCVGQEQLNEVVPNGHLASVFRQRAFKVTSCNTLISMEGVEGSYLLETLMNFVCDRVSNNPFEHDLYVMAPCCEPEEIAEHQPITLLLIAVADLSLFETWSAAREIQVEHGSDGARILTLMEMAKRFRAEQEKIAELRKAGQRTRNVETMYILDLTLDKRTAPAQTKKVPWGRFESVLKQLNLE